MALLVLEDPGHEILRPWLASNAPDPIYSDFGTGEMISAISLRVRSGIISDDQGLAIVRKAALFTAEWSTCLITSRDIAEATSLVTRFDLKLRLPDAIHIALARRIGATLVTSDRRQADAAIALDLPVFNPLAGAAS